MLKHNVDPGNGLTTKLLSVESGHSPPTRSDFTREKLSLLSPVESFEINSIASDCTVEMNSLDFYVNSVSRWM